MKMKKERGKDKADVEFICLQVFLAFLFFSYSIFNNNRWIRCLNNGYAQQQHNAERLLKLIEEIYRWLPLGTIVNNRVFVVHGGISDTTDLDLLKSLDRGKVSIFACFLGFNYYLVSFRVHFLLFLRNE